MTRPVGFSLKFITQNAYIIVFNPFCISNPLSLLWFWCPHTQKMLIPHIHLLLTHKPQLPCLVSLWWMTLAKHHPKPKWTRTGKYGYRKTLDHSDRSLLRPLFRKIKLYPWFCSTILSLIWSSIHYRTISQLFLSSSVTNIFTSCSNSTDDLTSGFAEKALTLLVEAITQ